MKIELREEQKEKYKEMNIEEIMEDLRSRTSFISNQELINCACWIKEESQTKNVTTSK